MTVTKGSCESEISKAVTQWEKEYLGRGSLSVKTDILRNMIIIVKHKKACYQLNERDLNCLNLVQNT